MACQPREQCYVFSRSRSVVRHSHAEQWGDQTQTLTAIIATYYGLEAMLRSNMQQYLDQEKNGPVNIRGSRVLSEDESCQGQV